MVDSKAAKAASKVVAAALVAALVAAPAVRSRVVAVRAARH